ncbi:MAG: hypothetical protein ACPG49_03200 [Chitinophagales bacterium]
MNTQFTHWENYTLFSLQKSYIYIIPIFLSIFLCFNTQIYAQMHKAPSCSPNFPLGFTVEGDVNEFDLASDGSLSHVVSGIDAYTFTYKVAGKLQSLERGPFLVSNGAEKADELILYSNGIGSGNITITINISPPIAGTVGMTFNNIYKTSGMAGDKLTVSASYLEGEEMYPTFTTPNFADYTTDEGTGVIDASTSSFTMNQTVGANWDVPMIDQITVVWEDCSTCDRAYHGVAIGGIDFCTCVNAGTFGDEENISFMETEDLDLLHYGDYNDTPENMQTYALTNDEGTILKVNRTPNFPNQKIGEYKIYAINYKNEETIHNYAVGNNIEEVIAGEFVHVSSKSFMVVPYQLDREEDDESESGFDGLVNVVDENTESPENLIQYLLKDEPNLIFKNSPKTILKGAQQNLLGVEKPENVVTSSEGR